VTSWSPATAWRRCGRRAASDQREEPVDWNVDAALERRDDFIDIMRHAIALNGSFFTAQRMMQEYVIKAYHIDQERQPSDRHAPVAQV